MTRCSEIRVVLDQWLEGTLDSTTAAVVEQHVATCASCHDETEVVRLILTTSADVRTLQPPAGLEATIASSTCQRWQTLMFQALDNLLPEDALERVIEHMDRCPDCRRVWADLTLVRQAGEALRPPAELAQRCVSVRRRRQKAPVGLRTAAAAALVLAVLTSFLLGNLMTNGKSSEQVLHTAVGESVTQVADTNISNLRLMVWQAWHWIGRQLDAADTFFVGTDAKDSEKDAEDLNPAPTPAESTGGEPTPAAPEGTP